MSTSEGRPRTRPETRPEARGYRYEPTRNFRDRRSFSARHTMTGFNSGFDSEFDSEFETARIEGERLGEHLAHEHGRMLHEIAGLPLQAIHELEHIEAAMGLLQLNHHH